MRTDHLIEVLAADAGAPMAHARHGLWSAWLIGGAGAAVLLLATIGARTDLAAALTTWRFDLKLFLVVAAVAAALIDCQSCLRPDARRTVHWPTLAVALLLLSSVIVELAITPWMQWGTKLVGTNSLVCLVAVPALAIVPFITIFWAVRRGAPASPTVAGAAAGRLAATTAAAFYALHCFDDSPLFVATWYSIAIAALSFIGALLGRRALRW